MLGRKINDFFIIFFNKVRILYMKIKFTIKIFRVIMTYITKGVGSDL